MKTITTYFFAVLFALSLSALAGDIETITTTSSTGVSAELSATSVRLKGMLEQVTLKCGSGITGNVSVVAVPLDSAVPETTITNITAATGNVSVFPRTPSGDRFFLWADAVRVAVTNLSTSNVTFQATLKISQ